MAPCGGFPQLKAAIANGADSVYVGLTAFSARARAANFSPSELNEAVKIAHKSGVKVYVAMNVLVFQGELEEVAEWIQVCDDANVDALIARYWGYKAGTKDWLPQGWRFMHQPTNRQLQIVLMGSCMRRRGEERREWYWVGN